MPDQPETKQRLDRVYLTQEQMLALMKAQVEDNHALRQDVGEIKEAMIGTLDKPGGLAGMLKDAVKAIGDLAVRVKSLEDSRDQAAPIVASHKARRRDVATVKGVVLGAAALAAWEWAKAKFTGKGP